MAKQTGIHGLRGKVNGMSYYSSKNGGSLVRKINEGLGERVKSSREYSNTRKNNAEFGACGDFAGAFIGTITSRWRFILNSIATGMMVKASKAALALDSTSPWGGRTIQAASFSALMQEFNAFSKNAMPEVIANGVATEVRYNTTSHKTEILQDVEIDDELIAHLHDIGATGCFVDLYHFQVNMPEYLGAEKGYSKATTELTYLSSISNDVATIASGQVVLSGGESEASGDYEQDDATVFPMLFVLFRPYRQIGSEKNVLQQYCAGAVYAPATASA